MRKKSSSKSEISSPSKRADKRRNLPGLKIDKKSPFFDKPPQTLPFDNIIKNNIVVVPKQKVVQPVSENIRVKRKLTIEEILYIADVIPVVPSSIEEIGIIMQQHHKNIIISQLLNVEIYPLSINILRAQIEYYFYKSLIEPGKTEGITCAEATAGPLTQLTLSSFHMAGSAVAGTSGVDAMKEMFNVSPNRKKEFTTIHFLDKYLSFEEVYEKKKFIDCTTLNDLVNRTSIVEKSETQNDWWLPVFFGLYPEMKSTTEDANVFLRLYLDVQKLYNYEITTEMIAEKINSLYNKSLCRCLFSPTVIGIIDVYPTKNVTGFVKKTLKKSVTPDSLTSFNDESVQVIFLQRSITNKMPEIIIQGIEGLTDFTPVSLKISLLLQNALPLFLRESASVGDLLTPEELTNLMSDHVLPEDSKYDMWKLIIDDINIRFKGIPIDKIVKLLEEIGLVVLFYPESSLKKFQGINVLYSQLKSNCIIIYVPKNIKEIKQIKYNEDGTLTESDKKFNPVDYINYCINKANYEKKQNAVIGEKTANILKYSVYVYAETSGINMRSLLSNPNIDPLTCKCNNFHIMNEYFDIEVTRSCFIREFYEHITNNAANINARYLILIADFVTNQGFPIPLTSRGVVRQKVGTFAEASFENAMNTFIKAACSTRKENIKSASAAIFLGVRGITGTGILNLLPDEKMLTENKKILDEIPDFQEKDLPKDIIFEPTIIIRNNTVSDDLSLQEIPVENKSLCPKNLLPEIKKFTVGTSVPEWVLSLISVSVSDKKTETPVPKQQEPSKLKITRKPRDS